MAVSAEFENYVLEQLAMGSVITKKMFGGIGLYDRNLFFGILFNNNFYLKVDVTNRADYENAEMPAFKPYKNRPTTMQYYEVPAEVLEDKNLLRIWAQKAIEVARKSKTKSDES